MAAKVQTYNDIMRWLKSYAEFCGRHRKRAFSRQNVVYPTGLTVGKQVVEGGMPNQPSFDSAGDG